MYSRKNHIIFSTSPHNFVYFGKTSRIHEQTL
jgi:hypothetical protein